MAAAGRARELLLPLLFLPLAIPIVVGGVGASVRRARPLPRLPRALRRVFVLIAWASFEYVVTEWRARARRARQAALLAGVRPERDQRAEQEDEPGEPDQVDERVHEHLQYDRAVLVELSPIMNRSCARSQSVRIATSFETCCSAK